MRGSETIHNRLVEFYGKPRARAIALVGPPSALKHALVHGAAVAVAGTRTTFIAGPDPSGARTAWYPIVSALAGILQLPEAPEHAQLSAALASAELPMTELPGLAEVFGLPRPRGTIPEDVVHRGAIAAALVVLRYAVDLEPRAMLCFEDVEEYDQPSLQVLARLLNDHDPHPPVILTTTEDTTLVVHCPRLSVDAEETAEELVARLHEQAAETRAVLQAAAAFGTSVVTDALGLVECVVPPTALDLERLASAGYLLHDGRTLTLASYALRDLVREATPPARRQELARDIAQMFAQQLIQGSVSVRAHHTVVAGDETAFSQCLLAARDSLRRFDEVGAVRWFSTAQAVAATEQQRWSAALGLAGALRATGELDAAEAALVVLDAEGVDAQSRAYAASERG